MVEKPKLARQAMCDRLAMEFQDDWIVNLGVGMPTLCSNDICRAPALASEGEEDPHLVNAGGQKVTAQPWMSIVHHADSFGLIRSGRIDVTVMGAYEVAESGDFANWRVPARKGGGIGGAMDLAACAKRVFIALEHTTRDGKPRLLKRCQLPITAPGVVTLVATDLGLFEVTPDGFVLREYAPGWTPDEIQHLTEATLILSQDLQAFRCRD